MHQPHYQDLISEQYQLPWTYLHAVKDYVDMAAHLERVSEARAVVNFAPILLEQIEDYGHQLHGFLSEGQSIHDPLLAALAGAVLPCDGEHRLALVKSCLKVNEARLINRFKPYRRLADLANWFLERPESALYLSDQFLADLLVWYHLAWLGETVRRGDERVKTLVAQGGGYNLHDRRGLMEVIADQITGVIGRYRRLAETGRVELSVTPYAHPILPLLLDLHGAAREAVPDMELPEAESYPGGAERARRHLEQAITVYERYFGTRPRGCWPSEGSISDATLGLLDSMGFSWAASGENVLRNSLARAGDQGEEDDYKQPLYHPYRLYEGKLACFFRDDGLSDLLGFTYADWHADDAVSNLVHHLENIAKECDEPQECVVSIILDGENAWEYYPENGYYFLRSLYQTLAKHPGLELTTFSAALDEGTQTSPLPGVVAGSWVYGTLSTWIGDPGKNRGWDMLVEAKRVYDEVMAEGRLDEVERREVERQLAICEGSDWFWWFGDYNPAETVSDFEHLFRLHLANLYQRLGREPPDYLSQSFTHGKGKPQHGGVMRRGTG